jgi:hypothetical protein
VWSDDGRQQRSDQPSSAGDDRQQWGEDREWFGGERREQPDTRRPQSADKRKWRQRQDDNQGDVEASVRRVEPRPLFGGAFGSGSFNLFDD